MAIFANDEAILASGYTPQLVLSWKAWYLEALRRGTHWVRSHQSPTGQPLWCSEPFDREAQRAFLSKFPKPVRLAIRANSGSVKRSADEHVKVMRVLSRLSRRDLQALYKELSKEEVGNATS